VTGILGGFGGELGKSLASKWLGLLALSGALYLAVVAAARALGQAHALNFPRLARQITAWARDPAVIGVGGQVVLLAAVLAISVALGLVARVLGAAIERVALAPSWRAWPRWARAVARSLTLARQRRWDSAHRRYGALWAEAARALALDQQVDGEPRYVALRARTSIALERPDRPTWCGDRVEAVSVRLLRDHGLDLALLWPSLWLILPEQERKEITEARAALTRAAQLGAWAVLYAPLTYLWWPAAVLAVLLAVAAHRRTRAATDDYARLVEAAVRLRARDLARQLGIELTGPLPADAGDRFYEVLGSTPPPAPASPNQVGS
jgi:hypothetical protein